MCSIKDRLTVILLSLFACSACHYNGTEVPVPPEGSVVISNRLSNHCVNGFAEDRLGHVWIATQRGINRFDGHEYVQFFSTDDEYGLPDNQTHALHTDRDGRLWVSTVNGAAIANHQGSFLRIPVDDDNRNLNVLLETSSGRMLFSNGTNLLCYLPEQGRIRPVIPELNAFGAPSMVLDREDRLWVISGGGFILNCYSTEDWSLLHSTPVGFQAYHLADAQDGTLWLSGMGGLGVLDTASGQWLPLPSSILSEKRLTDGDIDILFPLDGQRMLMNVIGKGFFLYQKNRDRVLCQGDDAFPYTIPEAEIRSIFQDSRQNLWFGTMDKGYSVSYSSKGLFGGQKSLVDAFKGKTVNSLCTDKDGNLWINTLSNGLWCYNLAGKQVQPVENRFLIPDSDVGYIRASKVFCDSGGDLWLLFSDKFRVLRCRWDGKSLRQLDYFYCLNPLSIAEDDQGYIWVGGLGGALIRYDKATRSTRNIELLPPGQWTFVPDLLMKEAGRLEAACFNQFPVEVNTYTLETKQLEIPEEEHAATIRRSVVIPTRLFKDSAGDLWLGTIANGLIRHDGKTGKRVSLNGLPCLDVCSIEEDRQGNIWVSTMDGLCKYDRTTGHMIHYREDDGTGGNQYSERASCILEDGTLIFGGTHGLTCFNPLDTPAKRTVPIVFEYLTIHNQLVRPSDNGPLRVLLSEKPEVVIRHNHNAFDITFSALDYSEYEQIRYAYRLEGFDKDWVRIDARHNAYFSQVPAGRYRLRVKIANGSHTITETEESLAIRVLPPWQCSWWAWILWSILGSLILSVLYVLVRRVRQTVLERERAEEARKAEKELNRIQMNYFSNVAHEFRTPLTMIAGPAQQLSESETVQGMDRRLVDIIRRNATWMLSLVNQLLDFNRIGNSKLQLKVARIDIVEALRDTAGLFRFNARSKGIEFQAFGLEDSFTMWADADKMQKVVMNLLSNAMKFTPSGGRVTLAFDVVPREEAAAAFPLTAADTDSQYAQITVSDTGRGIPEGELEKIFERFYQADNQGDTHGSGIGLYYARILAGLHHGYIKAANREEGGAVFSLILPVNASSYSEDERTEIRPVYDVPVPDPEEAPGSVPDEASRKRIAVVDDDIDIANYVKVLLNPYYNVTVYFDAASALKGMQDEIPDLVVSDVVMPGMSGYDLCEAVKGDLQLSHIPVVLVTAKVAVENQVQGLGKGADAYVTKPFQPAYLLALVKSLLENREKLHKRLGSVTTTEDIEPEALSPRDAAFMKELYELMEKELANVDLDITRITEMMRISRTKFYYKVKGLTGENPAVFFKRYKLNRAADLLKEGKHNMSEIAYMTGFNTLSHFSTSFKKQFGVPPSEYAG